MADYVSTKSAPFTRAVFQAIRQLYPESLADKSWDNTGALLEAPFNAARRQRNSVLLTVDLTREVAEEAIRQRASVVVAYHPIIFKGLKSLTLDNTQQQSLLRLAANGISVYSPHTALDSAPGGINDWLADILTASIEEVRSKPLEAKHTSTAAYSLLHMNSHLAASPSQKHEHLVEHSRDVIKPVQVDSHPGAGQGRIVRFTNPQRLSTLIERIATAFGSPTAFSVAIPQGSKLQDLSVRSVGICAGSGGSLLGSLDADLLFTGELSHHEALAAIERNQIVITLFHSNTERGFLHAVLRDQLEQQTRQTWSTLRQQEMEADSARDLVEALLEDEVRIQVSESDRDPYGILVAS